MNTFSLRVGPPPRKSLAKENLTIFREAIRKQKKIRLNYQSKNKRYNQKTVWPFTIGYFVDSRILVAWCEKQREYHHFNTLWITSVEILDDSYPRSRNSLFREWQTLQLAKISKKSEKNS